MKLNIPQPTLDAVDLILKKNPWLAYKDHSEVVAAALKAWIIRHRDLDRRECIS